MRLALALMLLPVGARAGPAVDAAVAKAGLEASDPLPVKVEKVLNLLTDESYLGRTPKPGSLPPPFDQPYHLDSLRTPEQILSERRGGYCASWALAAAAMLARAGVPLEDMRVVEAVNDDDLAVICPRRGRPRAARPRTGASGHVFVAVRWTDGGWRLINTVGGARSHQWSAWFPPERLETMMRAGPVPVPRPAAHGRPYKPMTVFVSWRPDEFPLHTFDGRLDLVASGVVGKKTCRYSEPRRKG